MDRTQLQEMMARLAQLATVAREATMEPDCADDVAHVCVIMFLDECAKSKAKLADDASRRDCKVRVSTP